MIYIDTNSLINHVNLKDADYFKELFTNENLEKYCDVSDTGDNANTLFNSLNVTSEDWLELFSFIKNLKPMYYSLDIFNDPTKKESFIFNLEKLNVTVNKFGGLEIFDNFYKNFMETANNNVIEYYDPQEPSKDYKNLFIWGLGSLSSHANSTLNFQKYDFNNGWTTTKTFLKNKDVYAWFRKDKQANTEVNS